MSEDDTIVALFDKDGRPVGATNIPTGVIEAAARVCAWLRAQPAGTTLHGLRLAAS